MLLQAILSLLPGAVLGISVPFQTVEQDVLKLQNEQQVLQPDVLRLAIDFDISEATAAQPSPHLPPPRPLVVWHGLGDTYASAGMLEFMQLIKEIHEGIFIHSVYIEVEPNSDQRAGWFGNVNLHLDIVADELANIKELRNGFDAIGFSQGGQFLRGYAQRYTHLPDYPPVRNLITFGSQHMGISDMPGCKPTDFLCRAALSAARGGMYTAWAQSSLVPAQYFRDPARYETYLEVSGWLADINNERPDARNETYVENFTRIEGLVLVIFDKDKTVVPKESSWFGSYNVTSDEGDDDGPVLLDMKETQLYKEDWIGLRTLDEDGRVWRETCKGEHMQMPTECWEPLVKKFVGKRDTSEA